MTVKGLLEIAVGEIGCTESPPGSNRTKYGAWYGLDGEPWCMMFVQWCFSMAGWPLPYRTASCSGLESWYREHRPGDVHREPEPGDIVIYTFGHTGIVERVDDGGVTAIEGNTSPGDSGSQDNGGGVYRRHRGSGCVSAFIRPEYVEEDMDISKLTDQELLKMWSRISALLSQREPGEWSLAARAWAEASGIISGDDKGAMAYRRPATREELVQVLYNMRGADG